MKIGIFDPYLDTKGGGERYMLTLAECLSSTHKVEILWNKKEDVEIAAKRFNLNLSKVNIVANTIYNPTKNFLSRIGEEKKYDILIYLSDGSIPFSLFSNTIIHFQFPIEWVNVQILDLLKIRRIKKIICNSKFTKKYIDRKLHIKSDVLYPPVDVEYFLSNKTQKENIIVSVGRYQSMADGSDFKRIAFMLDVFCTMVDKGQKNWKFIIATSYLPSEKEKIKILEKKYSSYPIEILHSANASELKNIYTKSKIYWHAAGYEIDIEKHPEQAEHFGITTVEAMSACCVPVVYNAGGQKEIIQDGKNGFVWNTKEEFIKKTLELIQDEKKLELLAEHGQLSAKQYSKKNFCMHLNSIINSI